MIDILNRYGFWGIVKLVISKTYTLLFFPKARLLRLPIDIRNARNIDFGIQLTTGPYCRIEAHPLKGKSRTKLLTFGKNVQINDFVHIVATESVSIGNNVLMASKIFISDSNHGDYSGVIQSSPDQSPAERVLTSKPVVIEDNVWLGEFVTVLQGVTIGKGSIIGAMSVVSRDVPPFSIAVGSPARVIKKFDFETKRWKKHEADT